MYVAIPVGIIIFVLPRISAGNLVGSGLLWGAIYGVVVYTVYDMTNYSLVRDWPLRVAVIDVCWGGLLNAVATVAAAWLDRLLK